MWVTAQISDDPPFLDIRFVPSLLRVRASIKSRNHDCTNMRNTISKRKQRGELLKGRLAKACTGHQYSHHRVKVLQPFTLTNMSLTGANLSIMLDQCNDDPYPRSLGILTHGKSVPSITDTDDISKKPFIQAQFASQTPTPYNTRVGSPIVGINARYTAGHAARMTDKLESLAVERV